MDVCQNTMFGGKVAVGQREGKERGEERKGRERTGKEREREREMKGKKKKKATWEAGKVWEEIHLGKVSSGGSGEGTLHTLTFLENPTDRKTKHHFLKGENSY